MRVASEIILQISLQAWNFAANVLQLIRIKNLRDPKVEAIFAKVISFYLEHDFF